MSEVVPMIIDHGWSLPLSFSGCSRQIGQADELTGVFVSSTNPVY